MSRDIAAVADDLAAALDQLPAADPRRVFVHVYRRTTLAVGAQVEAGGFTDLAWLRDWDVAFADLFLRPLGDEIPGRPVTGPLGGRVRVRPGSTRRPDRAAPAARNERAHQLRPTTGALAVISDEQFRDPAVRIARAADHRRVDAILSARVAAEDAELDASGGPRSWTDQVLQPLNRAASRNFLREARHKV